MKTTAAIALATVLPAVSGHGHMVYPASTRNGGSLARAGDCTNGACFWFSNNVEIPGAPVLKPEYRSVQADINGGANDVFKTAPWRAPGTAPVFGSGCGVAGGDAEYYLNGGMAPKGSAQGADGLTLTEQAATVWTKGRAETVGWAISANHGGGYSYRLCKKGGDITEECFQRTPLRFAGNTSWIQYADGRRTPFTMTKVTEGTFPAGSEWARDPVPGCRVCQDAFKECGEPMPPVAGTGADAQAWNAQVDCFGRCDGSEMSKVDGSCPEGTAQFPAPLDGISGFGKMVWDWSVMDSVLVPKDLETGDYLLSWRWDCEESTQVWQNCADISVVDPVAFA